MIEHAKEQRHSSIDDLMALLYQMRATEGLELRRGTEMMRALRHRARAVLSSASIWVVADCDETTPDRVTLNAVSDLLKLRASIWKNGDTL